MSWCLVGSEMCIRDRFILALVWVIFYSEEFEDEIISGDRERIE
jgi:hypothetical protein